MNLASAIHGALVRGEVEQARTLLQAADRGSEDPVLWHCRGWLARLDGREKEAEEALERARSAAGDDPEELARLAQALHEAGELVRAEAMVERALDAVSGDAAPVQRLQARIHLEKDRFDSAREVLLKIASAYREDPDWHLELAAALRGLGRHREAIGPLEEALRLRPDTGTRHELARTLIAAGALEEARELLEAMVATKAEFDARTGALLGKALLRLGRLEQARAWLKRARSGDPTDHEVAVDLGHVAIATDRLEEAEALLREVLLADPTHRVAQEVQDRLLRSREEAGSDPASGEIRFLEERGQSRILFLPFFSHGRDLVHETLSRGLPLMAARLFKERLDTATPLAVPGSWIPAHPLSTEHLIERGREASVRWVVSGQLYWFESSVIELHVVDVEKDRTLEVSESRGTRNELAGVVAGSLRRLLAAIEEEDPDLDTKLTVLSALPIAAFLHWLGLHVEGLEGPRAPGRLFVILDECPGFRPAREALLRLASSFIKAGWLDQSGEILERLETLAVEDARIPLLRGHLCLRRRDLSGAVQAWEESCQIDASSQVPSFTMGRLYASLEDWDRAEAWYRRAVEASDHAGIALGEIGTIHARRGDLEGAMVQWKKAIALEPHHVAYHVYLAHACLRRGMREAALEYLDRARAIDPDDPLVRKLARQLGVEG